jgi:two-component system, OmpR family, sensor histidine kinase ChvG
MRLRQQLVLLAAAALALPAAGWVLVRELEAQLRRGQEAQQTATLEVMGSAIERALLRDPGLLPLAPGGLNVPAHAGPIEIDGYDSEWTQPAAAARVLDGGGRLRLRAARSEQALHLLIEVDDASRVRAEATQPEAQYSDRVELDLDTPEGRARLRLANSAPGALSVQGLGGPAPRLSGYWQEDARGYRIELRLPPGLRPLALGVQAIDHARPGEAGQRLGDGLLRPLREPEPALGELLAALCPLAHVCELQDAEGQGLLQVGELAADAGQVSGWRRLFTAVVGGIEPIDTEAVMDGAEGAASARWRAIEDGNRLQLSTRARLQIEAEARGVLVLRQASAALLLADRALLRVLAVSLAVILLLAGLLYVFAGRLSARIRRLSQQAEAALARGGADAARGFERSAAVDELGELSRSFGTLLDEVAGYTAYLRSLAGTLSHELHTPLAVVRGSLDNLEAQGLPEASRVYLDRARAGSERLAAIVRAMGESSRIERAIASAEPEDFDLAALVRACGEGYRELLAPRLLDVRVPAQPVPFHGAPDLIVQALDKLVDNARSFCPPEGEIRIELGGGVQGPRLAVANTGPTLAPGRHEKLFDALVSQRPRGAAAGSAPHLGLGLHIVRLVAERHAGSARAANLADGSGVEFTIELRGMPRAR